MTSEEIKAAMQGVDSEESEVLAAVVRELYEALKEANDRLDDEGAPRNYSQEWLDKYRAALEEAGHE